MKLVIIDRDGTVNEDRDDYVKSLAEWVPLPGALEAITQLTHAGWHVVMATNQSGIGRGLFDMAALNAMHARLHQLLTQMGGRIESIFFCPHAPDDGCHCRKPRTGLLEAIARRYGTSLAGVPLVGDMPRDLMAGAAMGCELHLVRTGQGAQMSNADLHALRERIPDLRVHADLAAAATFLIRRERVGVLEPA